MSLPPASFRNAFTLTPRLAWVLCIGLIWFVNHYLKRFQLLSLFGTAEQQYWGHLAVIGLWTVFFIGLAMPAAAYTPRLRPLLAGLVAFVSLLLLGQWFPYRNAVAVETARGVYQLQRGEHTIITYK